MVLEWGLNTGPLTLEPSTLITRLLSHFYIKPESLWHILPIEAN